MRAYVFPGQGSQYVGMGQALAEKFPVARRTFDEADEALGFKLSELIAKGPLETLTETQNNQPAILTVSIAFWRVLNELKGGALSCGIVAGHSLGEYSALVAAEALDFPAAVKLVRARGKYMQEAVPLGKGTMAAILGVEAAALEEICRGASTADEVAEPAGYNCPGQIVIAGHVPAVERAMKKAEEAGGKAVALNVSGPFHSSPLKVAGDRLAKDLEHVEIRNLTVPYVPNVTGVQTAEKTDVKKHLVEQVSHAVRWEPSMREMLRFGVKEFVEVGPGRVLLGFVKKLDRKFPALAADDEKGWATLTA